MADRSKLATKFGPWRLDLHQAALREGWSLGSASGLQCSSSGAAFLPQRATGALEV